MGRESNQTWVPPVWLMWAGGMALPAYVTYRLVVVTCPTFLKRHL